MRNSAFILEHRDADVRKLVLQHAKNPDIDIAFVATQISGYQRIKNKVPTYAACPEVLYPVGLSIEQCSSESTARYKAQLVSPANTLVDLTGGYGIDTYFLAEKFHLAHHIEHNQELSDIAQHNFRALGQSHITTHCADSEQYLRDMSATDCIYIDPARRDHKGGKIAQLHECEPNIIELEQLMVSKAKTVIVKLSPMIDITHTVEHLRHVREVHVVSVDNECKEVLVVLTKDSNSNAPTIHTANITKSDLQSFSFTKNEEEQTIVHHAHQLGCYLYEPNASVMKAGAFKSIAAHFGLEKLHQHTHLYTSDNLVSNFPGRTFKITEIYDTKKTNLKRLTSEVRKANIATRNFPKSPDTLRKQWKMADGGEHYIFACTYANNEHIVILSRKA